MSYESDCNDYAVNGNPERDHWDYEENARYDQFDGQREDLSFNDDPGCPDCGYKSDCVDCLRAKADCAEIDFRRESADCEDCEVPF
jgi:hypothetical protein